MRLTLAIWLVMASWATAAPVPAGKGSGIPTELPIPANAVMVIHQNDYPKFVDGIKTMLVASFGKDGEKFWTKLNEMDKTENGPHSLQWKGVTKGERFYFAVMSFDFNADEPPFLAMVPVDDAKAFRASIFPADSVESTEKGAGFEKIKLKDGEDLYYVESKNRVYMCGSKELAETVSKPFESFKSKTLGDSAAPFFSNDLSFWLNIEAIREKYADEIQQFKAVIPLIMQQGAGQLDKQQLNSAKQMLELVFQLLDDGKGLVVSLSLKPDGVALGFHAAFGPNTPSGKAMVVEKPTSLDATAKLPAGFTIYTGNGLSPRAAQAFAKLYRDFAPADEDEGGKKAFDTWNAVAFDATATASALNFDRTGISAAKHPAAEKSVKAMIAALKAVGDGMRYQNIPLKGKPVVTESDKTFDGVAMHKIALTFDFEAFGNLQPEQTREATIASVKKLLPETLTMWVGSKGDMLVQVTAKEWATAEAILKKTFAGTETLGSIAGSKLTREGLPADVGAVTLLDMGKMIEFGADYAKTMFGSLPGLPFDASQIKVAKPKGEPSYVGFSLTMSGNSGSVDLFVPHRSIGMAYEAIKPMIDSGMMP